MAEFCLECYNKINHTHYRKWQTIQAFDLCEGCGEYKKTVVTFWTDIFAWPYWWRG